MIYVDGKKGKCEIYGKVGDELAELQMAIYEMAKGYAAMRNVDIMTAVDDILKKSRAAVMIVALMEKKRGGENDRH